MVLVYKKLTEDQDVMRNIFEKGEYPFTVKSIEQKTTKSGLNQMLVVELQLMNSEGRTIIINDWIVLDMENIAWKLRHFASSCGLLEQYNNEKLEVNHFFGKNGVAKINVSEYERDGELIKINKVSDYVKNSDKKIIDKNTFINDELPF